MKKINNPKIAPVRHGHAKYESIHSDRRGTYSHNDFLEIFEGAEDLKENTVGDLEKYFADYIDSHIDLLISKERIDIWISPFGRTLQTGYIFLKLLKERGINAQKICIFEKIGEVKNFERRIFEAMVKGLEVEIDGKKVKFDKEITNPQNLSVTDYFFESYWLQINPDYLKKLGVLKKIKQIESYDSITQRSQKTLSRLLNIGNDKMVFIFSHQAFTDWIIKGGEDYQKGGQNPGEIIHIGDDLFVNPIDYERKHERKSETKN